MRVAVADVFWVLLAPEKSDVCGLNASINI